MSLTRDQWQRVRALFDRLAELEPERREQAIETETADDPAVGHELRRLLASHDAPGHAGIDRAARAADQLARSLGDDVRPDARIGVWRITRHIASGGMGAVYEASRADGDFDQRVAIKLIRPGLADAAMLDRFRQERRILAGLSHPGIARLVDGGVTDDGRPYLALEYVDGEPIDHYCDRRALPIRDRLGLFLPACHAVQHAHQNLVVHRDLKPSNILVTPEGRVMLLDFGIAKLLGPVEPGPATPTLTGVHPLTPAYASPEQVRHGPITTATDVYSLGVVLYRLLAGRPPFLLEADSPHEIVRVLSEEPPAPSAVASDEAAALTGLPDRLRLRRVLAGDLDAIVLRALRKEPEQRYRSVLELIDDIERHLAGLPVRARRGTTAYRVGRFARRNRLAVAAAGALALALLAGGVATAWQARRATAQARLAEAARAQAERASEFLTTVFASADPNRDGRDVRVADVLDRAAARVEAELHDQPALAAALHHTLGETYRGLGLYDDAAAQGRAAVRRATDAHGEPHVATAAAYRQLGNTLREAGRYAEAEPELDRAVADLRRLGRTAEVELAQTLNDRAILLNQTGRADAAEAGYREALALYDAHDIRDERLGALLNNLGVVLGNRGDAAAAEALHRRALDIMRDTHGDVHPQVAHTLFNVAGALDIQKRYDEAEPLYREALAQRERLLGDDHPLTIWVLASLAFVLDAQQKTADAEATARTAVDRAGRGLPPEHPLAAYARLTLGQALVAGGRAAEAEPHLRAALQIRRATLGDDHWLVHSTESMLGGALAAQGRRAEAAPLLERSYTRLVELLGPEHERTVDAEARLRAMGAAGGGR